MQRLCPPAGSCFARREAVPQRAQWLLARSPGPGGPSSRNVVGGTRRGPDGRRRIGSAAHRGWAGRCCTCLSDRALGLARYGGGRAASGFGPYGCQPCCHHHRRRRLAAPPKQETASRGRTWGGWVSRRRIRRVAGRPSRLRPRGRRGTNAFDGGPTEWTDLVMDPLAETRLRCGPRKPTASLSPSCLR